MVLASYVQLTSFYASLAVLLPVVERVVRAGVRQATAIAGEYSQRIHLVEGVDKLRCLAITQ
jgi:hypothetical protein